jgi:hypothetical protein
VVHLSSSINIRNNASIPFQIALLSSNEWKDIGVCGVSQHEKDSKASIPFRSTFTVEDGTISKPSTSFGVPVDKLDEFLTQWKHKGAIDVVLKVTPQLPDSFYSDQAQLNGRMDFHAVQEILLQTHENCIKTKFDVTCRGAAARVNSFVLQATAELSLVDSMHLFLDITLDPRSVLVNNMPVPLSIRTPMPHTSSTLCQHDNRESIHEVAPGGKIEVFTPGPSVAINVKCADMPIAGTPMGWMDTWIDLPLTPEFGLSEPLRCQLPFIHKNEAPPFRGSSGCEFFIADGNTNFFQGIGEEQMQKRPSTAESYGLELVAALSDIDCQRTFFVTICNYAVDHSGNILLEQFTGDDASVPYSTFASSRHQRRITLLPRSSVPFRLLHLTMDGEDGIKRTLPFKIDNIAICEGGIGSTLVPWEDDTPSGYFVYRRLVTIDQSELHIIPEFIVFNSGDQSILVRQPGFADFVIDPGKVAPMWVKDREAGLILSLEFMQVGGFTPPLRVDHLGLRVALIKAFQGNPLGSIAIQTVIGASDSRFVVKIGEIKHGAMTSSEPSSSSIIDIKRDFLRFRIQASELQVTLNEHIQPHTLPSDGPRAATSGARKVAPLSSLGERSVCTFVLHRFTVDWQRVFKEEGGTDQKSMRKSVLLSPERSQLSVVIHNIQIRDETPDTPYPVVFDSTSAASFFDLCIRIRGPLDSDLIKVDLFDLNLAHSNGESHKMFLNTDENFVWKLLDLADRISAATGELASADMQLIWDAEHGGYVVSYDEGTIANDDVKYTPPRTGSIYDINKTRVSPFTLVLSFKRTPQASRYSKKNIKGGHIVKYFTRRLKFLIEKAELKFAKYETSHLKGPSDR